MDRFKDPEIGRPLFLAMTDILSKDTQLKLGSIGTFDTMKGKLSCDHVLCYFAIDFMSNITTEFMVELLIFLCLLRKGYNEFGNQLKDSTQTQGTQKVKYDFCMGSEIFNLPKLANKFIAELFPIYYNQIKGKTTLKYLGLKDNAMINLVFLMKFISNWLLIHDFTTLKIMINVDP